MKQTGSADSEILNQQPKIKRKKESSKLHDNEPTTESCFDIWCAPWPFFAMQAANDS